MKKFLRNCGIATFLIGAGLIIGSMITSSADGLLDTNQPGSVNDPLVSKSYVDERVQELVRQEIKGQTAAGQSAELNIVQLKAGQVLYAGAGTELIVRNGKTVAVSDSNNGIPDVTKGVDIQAGEEIETNHLLIFPAEGRGIKPQSDTSGTIYVMVRGDYLLVDME